ncbi:MAG TPA: chemotaxis protein CheW [Gemmatimonadales bacterium]|jgi:two-component system chemotaxis sensor kinase CheA|nr:chemotaxis protein CheW [Gemmatimonadales bacterium]
MTDARRARYVALFATEARSRLADARRALAQWQDAPGEQEDAAEEIFRALHTVKGMAASLEFAAAADLTHSTESTLSEIRRGERTATKSWLRDFERALDEITAACEAAIVAAGGEGAPTAGRESSGPRIVRVDLERLDALLQDLGGLVTARQDLERHAAADAFSPVARAAIALSPRLDQLQQRILDVRLAPLTEVLERIPPMVRDLARQLNKDVRVELSGETLEVDRAILDQLAEPLLHLLRNAVDHGIEFPDDRRAAGKKPTGRIAITARRDGDTVALAISDDGRGIDRERVAARARQQGILDENAVLNDDGLLAILARPGFSTAEAITDVSGRGVGLDVVAARLHEVGASLALTTVPGHGTVFSVRLPTRLGIVRALVTGLGEERYVVPLTHVTELAAWEPERVRESAGRTMLDVHGDLLPVVDLRRLLQYRGNDAPAHRPAVIFESGGQRVALLADAVHGQVDAVVQPIDRLIGMPRWITGATVLDGGRPALLVDLASVV